MSQSDKPLFTQHEHALEKANQICPVCGAELLIKHSKSGPFIGCGNYPHCDYTKPLVEHEKLDDKILEGSQCPECGHELAVKQGRYGIFIGCTQYPQCKHIENTHQSHSSEVPCPSCQKGVLQEKQNRYGKFFFSCNQYPQCKYVVNFQPVAQSCPDCGWSILIKRTMASGEVLMCPQKKCTYKHKAL